MRELEESRRLLYIERVNCERIKTLQKIEELQARRQDFVSKQEKMESKLASSEEAHAMNIQGLPAVQEEIASQEARQRKITGDFLGRFSCVCRVAASK